MWAKNSKLLDVWKDDLQMQDRSEIARGNSQNLLRILLLLYLQSRIQQVRWVGEGSLYNIIVSSTARLCEPRAGPARSEALDIWASACSAERADR